MSKKNIKGDSGSLHVVGCISKKSEKTIEFPILSFFESRKDDEADEVEGRKFSGSVIDYMQRVKEGMDTSNVVAVRDRGTLLERLRTMEWKRNQQDQFDILSNRLKPKSEPVEVISLPQKSSVNTEYFSGTGARKPKGKKKARREESTISLEALGMRDIEKTSRPPRAYCPPPAPAPAVNAWSQKSGSELFASVSDHSVTLYGDEEDDEMKRAIEESIRTAQEEQNRIINLTHSDMKEKQTEEREASGSDVNEQTSRAVEEKWNESLDSTVPSESINKSDTGSNCNGALWSSTPKNHEAESVDGSWSNDHVNVSENNVDQTNHTPKHWNEFSKPPRHDRDRNRMSAKKGMPSRYINNSHVQKQSDEARNEMQEDSVTPGTTRKGQIQSSHPEDCSKSEEFEEDWGDGVVSKLCHGNEPTDNVSVHQMSHKGKPFDKENDWNENGRTREFYKDNKPRYGRNSTQFDQRRRHVDHKFKSEEQVEVNSVGKGYRMDNSSQQNGSRLSDKVMKYMAGIDKTEEQEAAWVDSTENRAVYQQTTTVQYSPTNENRPKEQRDYDGRESHSRSYRPFKHQTSRQSTQGKTNGRSRNYGQDENWNESRVTEESSWDDSRKEQSERQKTQQMKYSDNICNLKGQEENWDGDLQVQEKQNYRDERAKAPRFRQKQNNYDSNNNESNSKPSVHYGGDIATVSIVPPSNSQANSNPVEGSSPAMSESGNDVPLECLLNIATGHTSDWANNEVSGSKEIAETSSMGSQCRNDEPNHSVNYMASSNNSCENLGLGQPTVIPPQVNCIPPNLVHGNMYAFMPQPLRMHMPVAFSGSLPESPYSYPFIPHTSVIPGQMTQNLHQLQTSNNFNLPQGTSAHPNVSQTHGVISSAPQLAGSNSNILHVPQSTTAHFNLPPPPVNTHNSQAQGFYANTVNPNLSYGPNTNVPAQTNVHPNFAQNSLPQHGSPPVVGMNFNIHPWNKLREEIIQQVFSGNMTDPNMVAAATAAISQMQQNVPTQHAYVPPSTHFPYPGMHFTGVSAPPVNSFVGNPHAEASSPGNVQATNSISTTSPPAAVQYIPVTRQQQPIPNYTNNLPHLNPVAASMMMPGVVPSPFLFPTVFTPPMMGSPPPDQMAAVQQQMAALMLQQQQQQQQSLAPQSSPMSQPMKQEQQNQVPPGFNVP